MDMPEIIGLRIHITGTVQGVGFRPFVHSLATRLSLSGWVRNTSAGVDIEVDGAPEALAQFTHLLQSEPPPLARIDSFEVEQRAANGFSGFEIIHSQPVEGAFQPISPDVGICPDCLRELFDPGDRRYLYPFTNCTNCGPRFTIIQDIPYDRPNTTMAPFDMCPDCAREYRDPRDRRFHAQPIACPVCGPEVWLEIGDRAVSRGSQAIGEAQRLLAEGKILAVKGLGGFHLACDATNSAAVAEMRRRKLRVDKPFALMMSNLETVLEHCQVNPAERELLESPQRPIVILKRKSTSSIAREVAPGQDTLGVMLPYTPLHYLLFAKGAALSSQRPAINARSATSNGPDIPPGGRGATHPLQSGIVLVMTSGNLSEEPIASENEEARQRLASLADAFLMHNRDIRTRCDDSVVRMTAGDRPAAIFLRRSRGYAPAPIHLPWEMPAILACGAALKNTFCLTRQRYAFLSHHIGDLENYETLLSFEDGVRHFERLFRIQPEILAYDLHPDYLSTRYALQRAEREGLPAVGVQHHHAHIAACMAEHGLPDEPVIGVAFDGTGYGVETGTGDPVPHTQSAIWGGEFLIARYSHFQRAYHLEDVPLPGGDAAVRKPARVALAHLWSAGQDWVPDLPCVQALCEEERTTLSAMLNQRINSPPTSSMGRLFDAVAAAAGVRQKINYEAQAAIELEALVDPQEQGAYPFDLRPGTISPWPMWAALVEDVLAGVALPLIAARFHNGVAQVVLETCMAIRNTAGLKTVVLAGGVWQNFTLLAKTLPRLHNAGFQVFLPRLLPPNDGGVALGQAAVAFHMSGGSVGQ